MNKTVFIDTSYDIFRRFFQRIVVSVRQDAHSLERTVYSNCCQYQLTAFDFVNK